MPLFTNGTQLKKHKVTCPHCQWSMEAAPFAPLIGGGFDNRLARYIGELKNHIERHHPEWGMEVGFFSAFLIAVGFRLEDPFLLQMAEGLRYALHRKTRRVHITDDQIDARVSRIEELGERERNAVAALLKDMRDVICEQGQYAPQKPAPEVVSA